MIRLRGFARWTVMSLAAALSLGAAAQPTVLKGKGITEEALIEALTPKPGDEGATGAPRTRSIKVIRDTPSAPVEALAQTGKKPRASILITFQTNSANLTADARSAVDVVAKALTDSRINSATKSKRPAGGRNPVLEPASNGNRAQ